jgi:hypothetical protein
MSMGGNPTLMVDVMANTAMLGTGLAQAEAQVRQTSSRMGAAMDGGLGAGMNSMLRRFAMPAMFLQIGDRIARSIADGMGQNRDIFDTFAKLASNAVEGIPLAGAFDRMIRKRGGTQFGISIDELMVRELLFGETPLPNQLGGGTFRSAGGGVVGSIPGLEPLLRSIFGDYFPKVSEVRGGVSPSTDPRRIESRIAFLQEQLQQAERLPTRSEMLTQQLGKVMGGSFGQIDTAIGSFKFAQETTESTAELVRQAVKQVDIMIEIRSAMDELKKLTTSN